MQKNFNFTLCCNMRNYFVVFNVYQTERVFFLFLQENKCREINIFASLRISADNNAVVVMQQMEKDL